MRLWLSQFRPGVKGCISICFFEVVLGYTRFEYGPLCFLFINLVPVTLASNGQKNGLFNGHSPLTNTCDYSSEELTLLSFKDLF